MTKRCLFWKHAAATIALYLFYLLSQSKTTELFSNFDSVYLSSHWFLKNISLLPCLADRRQLCLPFEIHVSCRLLIFRGCSEIIFITLFILSSFQLWTMFDMFFYKKRRKFSVAVGTPCFSMCLWFRLILFIFDSFWFFSRSEEHRVDRIAIFKMKFESSFEKLSITVGTFLVFKNKRAFLFLAMRLFAV